jgi:hypothetical protein
MVGVDRTAEGSLTQYLPDDLNGTLNPILPGHGTLEANGLLAQILVVRCRQLAK